jgi:hypothetical protein
LYSALQLCTGLSDGIHRVPYVNHLLSTRPERPGPVPGRAKGDSIHDCCNASEGTLPDSAT